MKFKGRFLFIFSSILFISSISSIYCFYFLNFNVLFSVLIILGMSLLVGIVLALLLKRKKDSVTELSIPILGYIEKVKSRNKDKKGKDVWADKLVTNFPSDSSFFEGYSKIWDRLTEIIYNQGELKTLLVTSTKSGEGKTITSLNLAIIAAKNKYKTLYVNADFRSLKNIKLLGVRNFKGLAGYLRGHATIEEILDKTNVNNLKMIASGTYALHPEQLLESKKMDDLLEILKAQFDLIIIDSTSLTDVEDTIILAKKTDGCLFVVNPDRTRVKQAVVAKQKLIQANPNVVGLIVNNVVKREKNSIKKSEKKRTKNNNLKTTKNISRKKMNKIVQKKQRSKLN